MKLRLVLGLSAALVTSSISLATLADDHAVKAASSEKQAKTLLTFRQANFQLIRSNMGPLGAMAKGQIPMDAEVIAKNSMRISVLGEMSHEFFATDTTSFDLDTSAKSSIWKEYADFEAKTKDMITAAQALQALAESGEEGSFRKSIGALGGTCKACHDKYKD